MKAIRFIVMIFLFAFALTGIYMKGFYRGKEATTISDYYIDMREIVDCNVTEYGFYLYTADGNGYYWER